VLGRVVGQRVKQIKQQIKQIKRILEVKDDFGRNLEVAASAVSVAG
jgi:hypothetical protein